MAGRHRILVVGVGSIGERHVRCFLQTGRVEVAICEIRHDLRRQVADRYDIREAYVDLDAAAEDPFEAAVIAVPAHLHVPFAMHLAARDRHLLIEKPLATSLDGISVLEQMVADKGLVVSVAYVHRCHPALAALRRAILDGRFGEPVQLIVASGQHFPTYRPAYREIYYTDRATGGGAIQDSLTHMVNAGEWLVGPIDSLAADAAHQVLEGVEVEDTVHVIARHGPVMACYTHNQHQAPNETTITVVCRRGTLRYETHLSRWSWMVEPGGAWQHEAHEIPDRDTLFVLQANGFLDALERRAAPLCPLTEGLQTLRVSRAILKCLENPFVLRLVGRD